MSDPTNKAELLAQMRTSYTAFEALLAPLSAAQLSTPGVNGEWTIKDILAHLTAWQERVSLRLEALARGEEARFEPIDNDEAMHAFNEATFATNRERPLADVLANFRAMVRRLEVDVEGTDELDLFDAGRLPWLKGGILWQSIAGNTYEHYEEHAPMIEQWLAGRPA